ncbi:MULTISPECIES: hypothetical protein [unclassified Streptomyces]
MLGEGNAGRTVGGADTALTPPTRPRAALSAAPRTTPTATWTVSTVL